MIRWPATQNLPARVVAELERLRGVGAFTELEADARTWTFENVPWLDEYPRRFRLRDDHFEPLEVFVEEDGIWWLWRPPEVPRFQRSPHSLG